MHITTKTTFITSVMFYLLKTVAVQQTKAFICHTQCYIADMWMSNSSMACILQIFISSSYHCLRSWWLNDKQFALTANINLYTVDPALSEYFIYLKCESWWVIKYNSLISKNQKIKSHQKKSKSITHFNTFQI